VIAVVDDEVSVCRAVVRVLQAAGFAALWYSSGDDFLGCWHFDRPACLLLDLQMPALSGQEVIQALNLAGARFPIIIITAYDAPSMRDECIRAGAANYLCKPMDARTLTDAVERAIASTNSCVGTEHILSAQTGFVGGAGHCATLGQRDKDEFYQRRP